MPTGDGPKSLLLKKGLYLSGQDKADASTAGAPGVRGTAAALSKPAAAPAAAAPGALKPARRVSGASAGSEQAAQVGDDGLPRTIAAGMAKAAGMQREAVGSCLYSAAPAGVLGTASTDAAGRKQQLHAQQQPATNVLGSQQPQLLFQHASQPREIHARDCSAAQRLPVAGTASLLERRRSPPQQQQAQTAGGVTSSPPLSRTSSSGAAIAGMHQQKQLRQQQQPEKQHGQGPDPHDDAECKERTTAWTKLLLSMRNNPEVDEFVYLKYARPAQVPLNPFDLQICSHADASKAQRYFTMSPAGVTSYFSDGTPAEFILLEAFQREFLLHQQLLRLPLFRRFRRWKALAIWRKAVRAIKTTGSVEHLQKELFGLNSILRQAIQSVRAVCLDVESQQLACLTAGKPATLDAFAAQHTARAAEVQARLERVMKELIATAKQACEASLAAMELQLMRGAGPILSGGDAGVSTARRTSAASDIDGKGAAAVYSAPHHRPAAGSSAAAEPIHLLTDSYALQAARRTQKRRLSSFVRLLDYMVSDCVHSVVTLSLQHVLQCLQGAKHREALGKASPSATACSPGSSGQTVLHLEVLLDQQHDRLLLEPHPDAFQEGLAVWLRGITSIARGVPRLQQCLYLQPFMEQAQDMPHNPDGLMPLMLGEDFEHLSHLLETSLQQSLTSVEHYAVGFETFRDMVVANRQFSREAVEAAVAAGKLNLEGLRGLLLGYQQQLTDVQNIPAIVSVGVLEVQLSQLKAALAPSPEYCLSELHAMLPRLAAAAYSRFTSRVRSYRERLLQQPSTPDEFVAHVALMAEVEAARPAMDREFDSVASHYDLLDEFGISAPEEEVAGAHSMDVDYGALRDAAWAAESAKDGFAQVFLARLQEQAAVLSQEVSKLRLAEQQDMFLQQTQDLTSVIAATAALVDQVQQHQKTAARISGLSVQCGGAPVIVAELEELAADVELKHLLWTTQQEWAVSTAAWLEGPFFELDVVEMTDKVASVSRKVHRLERDLPPNTLVPHLRDSVAQWQDVLGPVAHLRNMQLRERHWNAVAELLGRQVDRSPEANTSIATLLDMQVLDHKERIAVISGEATQEAALEALLGHVADKWRNVEFVVKRFKDLKEVYILGEVDDVMQTLEDSKITLSMIQASRYVGGIKSEVDRFDKQLHLFASTLEAWLIVQKGWLAVEAVFAAPDIQRQVPAEAAAFAQVDRTYKDIMRRTHDRPNALQSGTTPGWLEVLLNCGETLEQVQQGLEDYLETKRVAFPRFYFLSNEELLDILRQAKNPQAVQPHLSKCFEGIRSLEFGTADGQGLPGVSNDVLAMLSAEGERVMFGRVVKARGLVESWLSSVEANMRLTLKAMARKALKDYSSTRRPGWVLAQPAQLAVLVSNINWCQDVEAALLTGPASVEQQLQQVQARCILQLEELTELVRGSLSSLERKSVVALMTTDVHNRDIVTSLIASGVSSTTDFGWQMQLRFEYDTDTDSIMAQQVQARFDYGYEYLGAQPRLVVTPTTERCYMTLTGALHLKLGGAPSGPAGSGKTETVKDLGKSLGVQCVVFNCGEGLDHKFMAKFFSGLAQCGAWACFDELNRIGLEVLSVVAQQLLALQAAQRAGAERFLFEGREMALLSTCGVFITMNPGYAGRTELPDNLKVLFRPVAMVVPDYQLIAQVMLYSEGFDAAPWLAGKMVHLYKLASEQLSQQKHYDFGMRAVKAVLVMAGALKRRSVGVAEELVLMQAMREANLPKLRSEDIILFEAIMSDLFPNTQLPTTNQQQLTDALSSACMQLGLQPEDSFVSKAVQLHDTLGVRFGVMLVGPAGSGKTACYRCLSTAQTHLGRQQQHLQAKATAVRQSLHGQAGEQKQDELPHEFSIQAHVLNPKSISLPELYGSYNLVTHHWSDGLASSLVRAAVANQTQDMHWMVFDGPVDAVWIENMNTVLDDNRMLCLPNGERIKLDEGRMRMLFEVEDLEYASPATISRCGVVYVPSDVVGWRPYVKSWLNRYLPRQHAANLQPTAAPVAQPSAAAAEPSRLLQEQSRLPQAQPSTLSITVCQANPHSRDGAANSSQPSSSAGTNSSSCSCIPLERPEELLAVREFIWGLFDKFVDPLLEWMGAHGLPLMPEVAVARLSAVTVLFETEAAAMRCPNLFAASLEEHQQVLLQYLFAYCAVWGLGGCLASSCWDGWDKVVRQHFDGCANYPAGSGSVFDFYLKVDPEGSSVCFSPWESKVPQFQFQSAQPSHAIFVPTVDTCRYGSLLQGCMLAGKPALLVGATGVGKSAIVKVCVDGLHATCGRKADFAVLNCSAQTSSAAAQELMEANLVKRGSRLGPPAGHQLVFFIDDINLPERQQYGAQPPLEMLRLLLDRAGLYERKTMAWKDIIDTVVVGACGPPGGGRHDMSKRLTRHMLTLAVPAASELVMKGICSAILGGFMDAYFTPDVRSRLLRPLVDSCVEVFMATSSSLLPTPSQSHYTFNFRDVVKVMQGILSIRPAQCGGNVPAALTKLWLYEVQCAFGSRLMTDDDKSWLRSLQKELLMTKFGWKNAPANNAANAMAGLNFAQLPTATAAAGASGIVAADGQISDALFEGTEQVLFGDFSKMGLARNERAYEQLPSLPKLAQLMESYLDEFNASRGKASSAALAEATAAAGRRKKGNAAAAAGAGGSCKMELVFFRDAVLYVTQLARVLRQPRGSALLVGVGGSGKQSLARFAAMVADCDVFTPTLRQGYGLAAFREDVKQPYRVAGGEGRHVVFLVTDSHIVDEAMLGDINGLLNTGEITGLFSSEEQAVLLDQIRPWLTQQPNIREGRQAVWEAFIGRARHHLHVVFATSPVGDAFRVRCRQFPSLVNCTTIIWFSPWPAEALLGVGVSFLEHMSLAHLPQSASPGPATADQTASTTAALLGQPGPGTKTAAAVPVAADVTGQMGSRGAVSSGQLLVQRVAELCVEVHKSVEAAAERLHQEMKRRCYITPKLYLDLLQQYSTLLTNARAELGGNRRRLLDGIAKLAETNAVLDTMQSQLNSLQPLLIEKTNSTTALLKQVRTEQDEAEKVAAVVGAEEAEVASKAAECQALKDEAAAELAAVLPALEAAVSALDALNKADIIEMKTFIKPPALVQLTMEGVCILLQEKTDWDSAKRVLGDAAFIDRLTQYDKDSITERIRRELKRLTADPAFTPDQVGKQSKAAMSMCLWVRAMDTYATVYRIVEPKRQALAAAQAALDASNAILAEKQAQLKAIRDKVAALQQQLADTQRELASLQFQADLCAKRLGRAGKLTNLLGDELVRWQQAADEIAGRLELLVGDAFVAAAAANYLGAFTGPYRCELVAKWYACCQELSIPITTPNFSLSGVLSTPVELLEWRCQGLPTDTVSVENGLIATRGIRWPLMIDPQDQANRWIRVKEGKLGLVVVRASDPGLLLQVENAIRLGQPLLLEDLGDGSLPAGLEALYLRQVENQGGRSVVRLGDHDVDYDQGFKLYMTTRIAKPHYLPEAYIRVNLVDFTVTQQGLEEQLLADLVRAERPELEESHEGLVTSISADKRQLGELESKILRLLKEASGNLLDDETLIATLNTAKATSGIIQSRVREAELTEAQINQARDEFRGPPAVAANLWFVIADMAALDAMYQGSLAVFKSMYMHSITAAPSAPTLEARLQALVVFMTSYMHKMVCRGLFDMHKLVFTFMVAVASQKDRKEVSNEEWHFLLRGGGAAAAAASKSNVRRITATPSSNRLSNAAEQQIGGNASDLQQLAKPAWCLSAVWSGLTAMEAALPQCFKGLCQAISGEGNGSSTDVPGAGSSNSDNSNRSSITCDRSRPGTPAGDVSWRQLLLHGSLTDFIGSYSSSTNNASHESSVGGMGCLLDRLTVRDGLGQQQLQQQQQQSPSRACTPPQLQRREHSFRHQGSMRPQYKFTPFQRLLFVKVVREELFMPALRQHITLQLGPAFLDPPFTSLSEVYIDSSPYTLVILLLAQGADAIAELARFAAAEGRAVGKGLQVVSLGQGQGPVAEALVHVAMKTGDWVCLQNCHLAKSWMPQLAQLVEQLETASRSPDTDQQLHPSFRLWLTSAPVEYFPVPVLQKGVRVALEPPRGLKPTLLRSYASLPSGCLAACNSCGRGKQWQRLVFVAALLHGLVQERRKFGALGWNMVYEFTNADFSCALQHIQGIVQDLNNVMELPNEQQSINNDCSSTSRHGSSTGGSSSSPQGPMGGSAWEALRYIVGQIVYGGRMMDANDSRLLVVIMEQHLQPSVLGEDHKLTSYGDLTLVGPAGDDISSCLSQIRALPLSDEDPRLFGLPTNASIACSRKEGRKLIDDVLMMQPRMAAAVAPRSSGSSGIQARPSSSRASRPATATATAASAPADAAIATRVAELLSELPELLDRKDASVLHDPFAALPGGRVNSLGMVLLQEMDRFNQLLSTVRRSLLEVQAAAAGLQVLSAEAEATLSALLNHKVPLAWAAAAYPSSKPLASWLADLVRRVDALRQWLVTGRPAAFWLPGFFFPQGFLTGVLQAHARSSSTPIDRLAFSYAVLKDVAGPGDIQKPPEFGVYVYGLHLEAARWDKAHHCLTEPAPGEMFSALPPVHLMPIDTAPQDLGPAVGGSRGATLAEAAVAKARKLSQAAPDAGGAAYACPVYKTTARAGMLSTTGHSTNFLMHMSLPIRTGTTPQYWLLRGVAALCSLDD